jgi:2-polyprenyl-6-methoxyphenol hydroxylase-like FAD-dependent oxidoreductase
MHSTDLFVIGGGPAGLAAALAARRKGLDVTVADGARPPIDKACGEGLMPDGLAALNRLGVGIRSGDAQPFRGIRFLGSGAVVQADFPAGYGMGVRRTVLHHAMVRAAAARGVRLWWETPVSGITSEGVLAGGQTVAARWIVGADGFHSRVRRWADLDRKHLRYPRIGFRIHYRAAPWSEYMELYWGRDCQVYVTPVAAGEICVAVISGNSHMRLEDALPQFPRLGARLRGACGVTTERGAVTATCRLARVQGGRVALIGDASGSVDAITGEGLCLAFRQALALADSLERGSLEGYEAAHRRLARRPAWISRALLVLDGRAWLREPALRIMAAQPGIFRRLLALHVGAAASFHPAGARRCVPDL